MSPRDRERYVDPNAADLEAEHRYIQATTRQVRRVQMQRGDSWLVRFLPAALGPRKHWYARIAKHWISQKPIVCPRHTGADYGGDPDTFCPVCDEVASLDNSESDAVRDAAFQARAGAQWTTYCLVIEKSSGRGSMVIPQSEVVLPYTFDLYKTTFEELSAFYRNNLRKNNPLSVLDLVQGCDFWANKTAKGIRLDKQDPMPVLENLPEEPMNDPRIIKIMEQLHTPRVQLPSTEKLEEAADKLHEFATRPSEGRGGRRNRPQEQEDENDRGGRGSRRAYSEEAEEDTAPPPPRTRGRSPAAEPEPEDDIPGAETPHREAPRREVQERQEPAPAPRKQATREQPESQRSRAKDPENQDGEDQGNETPRDEVDHDDDAPVHRSVIRPVSPKPAPARPNPTAAAATASRSAVRPRDTGAKIDENEEVPEERTDRAPTAAQSLRDVNDPPPPVHRTGAQAPPPVTAADKAVMSERMKARIQAATQGRTQ